MPTDIPPQDPKKSPWSIEALAADPRAQLMGALIVIGCGVMVAGGAGSMVDALMRAREAERNYDRLMQIHLCKKTPLLPPGQKLWIDRGAIPTEDGKAAWRHAGMEVTIEMESVLIRPETGSPFRVQLPVCKRG